MSTLEMEQEQLQQHPNNTQTTTPTTLEHQQVEQQQQPFGATIQTSQSTEKISNFLKMTTSFSSFSRLSYLILTPAPCCGQCLRHLVSLTGETVPHVVCTECCLALPPQDLALIGSLIGSSFPLHLCVSCFVNQPSAPPGHSSRTHKYHVGLVIYIYTFILVAPGPWFFLKACFSFCPFSSTKTYSQDIINIS